MNDFKINDKELIEKFEEISFEYTKLLKEIFKMKIDNKISDEEWNKARHMIMVTTSTVFDIIPPDKLKEKNIIDGMTSVLNTCMDKNR